DITGHTRQVAHQADIEHDVTNPACWGGALYSGAGGGAYCSGMTGTLFPGVLILCS
ncbi:MAG: hypothetical protein HGB33_04750, partial [Syntrophaceae bacterium]|nr:hypothetical protein [Syntrophaceae bacterium]